MRHRVYGKHLGRDKDQRKTLFKGLVYSLISSGTIQTSETKAKAIKPLIDRVINLAKNKNSAGQLQSYVTDNSLRERLIKEIVPNLGARNSGYTSVVRMGTRLGDQTTIVKMSLIGTEQLKPRGSREKDQEKSKKDTQSVKTEKKETVKPKLSKKTAVLSVKKGGKKS